MRIAPKFSENDIEIPSLFDEYMQGYYEIQLLSTDLSIAFNKVKRVIENIHDKYIVEEIIVHMPFSLSLIEHIFISNEIYDSVCKLALSIDRLAKERNIRIHLLFHTNISKTCMIHQYIVKSIDKLINTLKDSYILLENEIVSLNNTNETPVIDLIKHIDNERLGVCIDICHIIASENALKQKTVLEKQFMGRVKSVHFSYTANSDGFKDKENTHSKQHTSLEDLANDMNKLEKLGIDVDNSIIVAEIAEADYINRPELLNELKLLHKFKGSRQNENG